MAVLITRPRADSETLARAVGSLGFETLIEPLTEIIFLPAVVPDLSGFEALVFTSANGVRAFSALSSQRDKKIYAVGDATAAAARENGFTGVISCGGTVEALNRKLTDDSAGAVLHIRGVHAAGAVRGPCETLVLYEARAASSLSGPCLAALAAGGIESALFFSARAGAVFTRLVVENSLENKVKPIRALCLSGQVVESLETLQWRDIQAAASPSLPDILALLTTGTDAT